MAANIRIPFLFLILLIIAIQAASPEVSMAESSDSGAVTRPTSDISNQSSENPIGTTYLKFNSQTNELDLAPVANPFSAFSSLGQKEHIEVVYPTSSSSSVSPQAHIRALAFAMHPMAESFGEMYAYTNYFFVRQAKQRTGMNIIMSKESRKLDKSTIDGLHPDQMRLAYNLPNDGGVGVIAIVDAYQYPNASNDLHIFSKTFGLPECLENVDDEAKGCLQKYPQKIESDGSVKEDVSDIPIDCGWNGEAALDLEWAHAIAPNAKLIFVQARSNSNRDLYDAIDIAIDAIKKINGGSLSGGISLSWGQEIDPQDPNLAKAIASYDSKFVDGPLYFVSSGDDGGTINYPAASPKVISVGGTFLSYNVSGLHHLGWDGSGGGASVFEPLPAYQAGVENIIGHSRNIPDISADASPYSGAAVYVSTPISECSDNPTSSQYSPGWNVIGGTSLAAPMVAAMVNVAAHNHHSVAEELEAIYGNRGREDRITDVTTMVGRAGGNATQMGYDNVTGVGTPSGLDFDK